MQMNDFEPVGPILPDGTTDTSVNPYSTVGARHLWQQGWDGVRPANLVDTSWDWRAWERGRRSHLEHASPESSL